MDPRATLDYFWPPEFPTPEQRKWAMKVSLTLLALGACIGFIASPWGMALAADVDKHINRKLEPIVTEQKLQGRKIDRQTTLMAAFLSEATATKIRLALLKRCKAAPGSTERDDLNERLRQLRLDYEAYAGKTYSEPSCADI